MSDRFRTINLTRYFNAPARFGTRGRGAVWHRSLADVNERLPRGRQEYWGIPFALGPKDLDKRGVIVLAPGKGPVTVPLSGTATYVCVAHFCNLPDPGADAAGGERLAEYVLEYDDGSERVVPIRRRFEVNPFSVAWGHQAFAAAPSTMPTVAPQDLNVMGWGQTQTGVRFPGTGVGFWVYAIENPKADKPLHALTLRPVGNLPIAVLGLTLYSGPGHPLRHVPRRVYKLVLPASEKAPVSEVSAELDLGVVTRLYAVPGQVDEAWLKSVDRGLGSTRAAEKPRREFLVEATGAEGATLTVKAGSGKAHELPLGEAFRKGKARSADGRARIELVHQRKTWVYVNVTDAGTGQPTPTRAHFRGANGEYLPPYGHHEVVNENWFEDYGGDLQLGGTSYAYVPGRFQIELPVGEVYVELAKGFEYEPLRKKLTIRPGQRELNLRIRRAFDQRSEGWLTADTHVHFISPQTAWLEGQAEGLNLINLLASQWGRLFTNVADITGEASGCSTEDTIVWVGTENRHHLLGHMSMLGAHGDPVFPMCAGGPSEAYLGDPDVTTLTDWARTVREREGVAIRPHFPAPVCEEPCYFLLDELDGTELRRFANPESGSLDEFCFTEWYRYLNCGCRVAAVGGTDKMSAGMPVGGVRTYAQLDPTRQFSFETWGEAVRAGRTYTTSGPLLSLTVEGHAVGDEIRMPAGGGTVEVYASAQCLWPIHRLEVVVNGKVVAASSSAKGTKRLSLKRKIKLEGSCWIAARAGSKLQVQHCWPIHLGAHTSPIYVVAGDQELFSPSDASYMLTLIDGGLTWLDTLSVRYDERRHRRLKAIFEQARAELHERAHRAGHPHLHPHG